MYWQIEAPGITMDIVEPKSSSSGDSVQQFSSQEEAARFLEVFSINWQNFDQMITAIRSTGEAARTGSHQEVANQLARLILTDRLRLRRSISLTDKMFRGPFGMKLGVWMERSPAQVQKASTPEQSKAPANDWIKIKVVDDQSGMAIKKVDLELKTPDGNTEQHATRLSGEIESLGLQSGNCQVSSDLKDATVEKTLLFVGVGEKPIGQKSAGETKQSTTVAPKMGIKYIASIEEHKVKTGEMPNSIASSAGMTWQALAKFNWGSEDPDEVNEHLANDVGCTKKTADGKNYLFDDADQPGIIYIPKQWKYDGLDTGIVHTIRVKPFTASDFIVQLQTDSGDAIPEAQFEAELSTGEKRKGTLDRKGEAVLVNPPPGPVIVWYPDSDDVYAKTLAVSARRALDRQEFAPIYELLQQSPTTIQMAIARYDQYFNDYTGNGFIEDLDTVFTDPDAHRIVGSLLARAGVQFGEPIEHFDWRQQDGC